MGYNTYYNIRVYVGVALGAFAFVLPPVFALILTLTGITVSLQALHNDYRLAWVGVVLNTGAVLAVVVGLFR